MSYPTSLDALNTIHADGVGEVIHAADINALAAATTAIEAELGLLPKGTAASVAARFTNLETIPFGTASTQSGTTYTLVLTDAGKMIEFTNAAAVTITIPLNSSVAFAVGTVIEFVQASTGTLTIVGAGGVTLDSPGGSLTSSAQWATITLRKRAADEWTVNGELADVSSFYLPSPTDHSLLGWSVQPWVTPNTQAIATQNMAIVKVLVPNRITITNVEVYVVTLGNTLTYARAALFAGNVTGVAFGTRLGLSADQTTSWTTTTGIKQMALTLDGGQSFTLGGSGQYVYVALLNVGTTGITVLRGSTQGAAINHGTGSQNYEVSLVGGQATMPSTLPALSASGAYLFPAMIS